MGRHPAQSRRHSPRPTGKDRAASSEDAIEAVDGALEEFRTANNRLFGMAETLREKKIFAAKGAL
jgi:hypothetical protein